jgi:Ca2+-binding EF-hand superfamily protein
MNLLIKTASEEEVQQLRAAFQQIDIDGTGLIKANELQEVLLQRRMNVSGQEINDIIS